MMAMMMSATIRRAACMVAVLFASAAIASAHGATGAGTPASPAAPAQATGAAQIDSTSADSNSLPAAANTAVQPQPDTYEPITGKQRLQWLATITLGPSHLVAGVFVAAYGTAVDKPREDGPHWGGFGERYGIRLTGLATANTMEAGLGAIWGEDPRYQREPEKSFGGRIGSAVEQAFITRRRDGHFAPAYARYMAISGSNFLSNEWRPNSEADNYHAGLRTIYGFAGQICSNAWDEFWPDARAKFFHK